MNELSIIPAMRDDALATLTKARTLADLLKAKDTAEALRDYAAKHKAPVETRNACREIALLAEARIGRLLKKAERCGLLTELPTGGITVPGWLALRDDEV